MTDSNNNVDNDAKLRDKFCVVDKPRTFEEFTFSVLRATCKLFYLLEGAERLASTHPDIWATKTSTPTFAAQSWMAVRMSYEHNTVDHPTAEYGPRGSLAQLAYVGWMAEVDGAWERYRTSKPFGDPGRLSRHGMEMTLMGEFRAIRNDLLKHGAVAQSRTAHCKELQWFPRKDQKMHLQPRHVIDFLHKLGVWYGSDMLKVEGMESVKWRYLPALMGGSIAVISHRAEVEEQDEQWLLVLSVVFADGVCGCYAIETAATREELQRRRDDLAAANPDSGGLRFANGELLELMGFYLKAKEDLMADKVNHLWSPPINIRK